MTLILFLIAVAAMIYSGIIFPIVMMIDCFGSGRLARSQKIGWFIAILVSWPLGATGYGFAASERPWLKWSILPGIFALGIFHWIKMQGGID